MTILKKNFLYNITYHLLVAIIPFLVVPYVSRVLNAELIGVYSYTHSIVYYFMMLSMLGIENYGNRMIAKVRDDKKELSKTFFGIYFIQIAMSFLMIVFYLLYIIFFVNKYQLIAFIQVICLISSLFNIQWFFLGLEKFNITTITGIVLKLLSVFSIFIFVKSSNDLWIYTLIMGIFSLLERLILFVFLKKEIDFYKIKFLDIKKHIKPCLILFIPVVSVGIYKQMDKVMLGILGNIAEVGYYERAERIVTMPMSIVTTLGVVMLPKISNLVVKNNRDIILSYMHKSIEFTLFLIFPICFGLIAISSDFVYLVLGEGFNKSSILINLLSFSTIFVAFASILRRQYLLPYEKDGLFIKSVVVGAISNFIINLILIPKLLSVGACIGTLIAEFLVMIIQTIYVSKRVPIVKYLFSVVGFFYKSIIMFGCVLLIKRLNLEPFVTVLIQIIFGIIIYFLLNIGYIKKILTKKDSQS